MRNTTKQRRRAHRAVDGGFTIIEVIIAMLMLVVVIAGIALAVSGGGRLQSKARASESMNAAALRAFEELRSNRGWMDNCTSGSDWCDVQSAVPDEAMQDKKFDDACGGSFAFVKKQVGAKPIDSSVDGVGDGDRDGNVVDYFRIRIVVAVPSCAANLLPNADDVVYESALDRRGEIPKGSLVIEVCNVVNQSDDRMSIAGCSGTGRTFTQMLGCPALAGDWSETPATLCNTAWSWALGNQAAPDASPSPFVNIDRVDATFQLQGSFESRSSADATKLGPGLYKFDNLPIDTYEVNNIVPAVGGNPELWTLKVIPNGQSSTSSARVAIQPDVRNRALLIFRPRPKGTFSLRFQRTVTQFDVVSTSTGVKELTASGPNITADGAPTVRWDGDPGYLMAQVADLAGDFRRNCLRELKDGDGECTDSVWKYLPGVPAPHCIRFGYWDPTKGLLDEQTWLKNTCTRYRMWADFEYYESREVGPHIREGAAMPASYAITPAPTFRVTAPLTSATPLCSTSFPKFPPSGGRVPPITGGCAKGRPGVDQDRTDIVEFGPLDSGLHTPIRPSFSPGSSTDYVDDSGGAWQPSRNESVRAIPGGLRRGIWVNPDGGIVTGDGPAGQNPQWTVIGRGECTWSYQGSGDQLGSCDPCEPFIAPEGGTAGSCWVLKNVKWLRKMTYTGGWADVGRITGTSGDGGDLPVRMVCFGRPDPGNYLQTVPNCRVAPPNPPRSSGSSISYRSGAIRRSTFKAGGGSAQSHSTNVGVS